MLNDIYLLLVLYGSYWDLFIFRFVFLCGLFFYLKIYLIMLFILIGLEGFFLVEFINVIICFMW